MVSSASKSAVVIFLFSSVGCCYRPTAASRWALHGKYGRDRHYSPPTSRTRGRDRYTLTRPRPHDGAHPTRVGYVAVAFTPRPEMGSLSTPPLARAAGCSRAHTHTHTPHRVGGHPKACPSVHSFPWSSESASMLARCTTCSLGPSGLVSTSAHCLAPSTKVGSSGRKRRALPCP
jgi:hypothetical protein